MVGVHPSHQCRHQSQQPSSVQLNLGLTLKGGGSGGGGSVGAGLWLHVAEGSVVSVRLSL